MPASFILYPFPSQRSADLIPLYNNKAAGIRNPTMKAGILQNYSEKTHYKTVSIV
jgi:hypothetical protein